MSATRGRQTNPDLERTWRDRVARWKVSGLSVRDFCTREGLPEPSFYSWRRSLAHRDAAAAAPPAPAFVPLHVRDDAPPVLELVLSSGHTLRIPPGFDLEQLRALVAALEGTPC
jgi:hypothetical protein